VIRVQKVDDSYRKSEASEQKTKLKEKAVVQNQWSGRPFEI
jgi:hypothetical protein